MKRFFANEKGQAFSTFKLLIAAVIAIAILTLLMPIIVDLGGFTTIEPDSEASSQLKSYVGRPGRYYLTKDVTFSKEDSMVAKSIAKGTGIIEQSQICF
ncbi:MAG: hypothetical protein ABH821_01670, partial [archaeon]